MRHQACAVLMSAPLTLQPILHHIRFESFARSLEYFDKIEFVYDESPRILIALIKINYIPRDRLLSLVHQILLTYARHSSQT